MQKKKRFHVGGENAQADDERVSRKESCMKSSVEEKFFILCASSGVYVEVYDVRLPS
jgi:hypothetical protein